jgi:hypothetical protein
MRVRGVIRGKDGSVDVAGPRRCRLLGDGGNEVPCWHLRPLRGEAGTYRYPYDALEDVEGGGICDSVKGSMYCRARVHLCGIAHAGRAWWFATIVLRVRV